MNPIRFAGALLALALLAAPVRADALRIVVLRGEGAFNNIKSRQAEDLAISVRDNQDRPVAGAKVVFTLPFSGPGGAFGSNSRTFQAETDSEGRAATNGYRPNSLEGRFNIKVTVAYRGQDASAIIAQTNTRAGGQVTAKKSHKSLVILALIGGGAAGGVLAARGRGGNSSAAAAAAPTSLSLGTITVGGPK